MGEAFLVQKYSVTPDSSFAVIAVTYPKGSACTCTNKVVTLTAPDMDGSWLCSIPEIGTWTVFCTDGNETASKDVEIATEGQGVSVTLDYKDYVVHNGVLMDGYQINTSTATYEVVDGALEFRSTTASSGNGNITINANGQAIDLSNRSTLYFDTEATSPRSGTLDYVTWGVSGASTVKKNLGVNNPIERQIVSIDISNISSGNISLFVSDIATTVGLRIYDAWFE